jgi:hypothetical protein
MASGKAQWELMMSFSLAALTLLTQMGNEMGMRRDTAWCRRDTVVGHLDEKRKAKCLRDIVQLEVLEMTF